MPLDNVEISYQDGINGKKEGAREVFAVVISPQSTGTKDKK